MTQVDVIEVYKRIQKAVQAGKGMRLSWEQCHAIWCDGAVRQAVETAEYESTQPEEGASHGSE